MDDEITINDLHWDELNTNLFDLISGVKKKYGLKGKLVVTIEDSKYDTPNGYGWDLDGYGQLKLTRGVFKIIDIHTEADVLEALIAHEMSHIANKDLTESHRLTYFYAFIVWVVFGLTIVLSEFNFLISGIVTGACSIVLIELFFRRNREIEIRCDTEALKLTKNPDASRKLRYKMANACDKIKKGFRLRDKPGYYAKRLLLWVICGTHPSDETRLKNIDDVEKQIMGN